MGEGERIELEELTDALRDAAGRDDDPQLTPAENWQQLTYWALGVAGIDVTEEEFERAWRTAWRRAFMGGSYTQDAKAILKAIREGNE